jgi:acyclic terpene utilization AtuA family protein
VRILAATGAVGFAPPDPERSFYPALKRRPQVIVADGGSADIGPKFLGADEAYNEAEWEELDLERLLEGVARLGIPLVIGSCGGRGTDAAVASYAAMADRIARRRGWSFQAALIFSEQTREWLHSALREAGDVAASTAPALPPLTHEAIDRSERIVAVMGAQPILAALRDGAQVVLAGRSCDDALFAASAIAHGIDRGSAFLAGKLLENASLVATPFVLRECILADVSDEGVLLEPVLQEQRCTRTSVAAELMYERRTPLEQAGPGGVLELDAVRIAEVDERRVIVTGGRYREAPPTLKVEGAGLAGYRSTFLVGCRDPRMIAQLDSILDAVEQQVRDAGALIAVSVFGRDAVMGPLEPTPQPAHEVAIVVETVAPTQRQANRACLLAKRLLFSARYQGQKQTGGSIISTMDEYLEAGAAYRWTVNHVLPVPDLVQPFRRELRTVGAVE